MTKDGFLDSSVAIGLVFRHAGERSACGAALPLGARPTCSRYVLFEVARGFLRRLIALHNFSFEFASFADLHLAAYSGQSRFRYDMPTWLGAFTDFQAQLESDGALTDERRKLEEFRAWLRLAIRHGWRRLHRDFTLANPTRCREDLPAPASRADGLLVQNLPTDECGHPRACGLQVFLHSRTAEVTALADGLGALPLKQKDRETERRISALRHLIAIPAGQRFVGKECHRAGDAIIALEASPEAVIATKNAKHFAPIATILGKVITVATTARRTADDV